MDTFGFTVTSKIQTNGVKLYKDCSSRLAARFEWEKEGKAVVQQSRPFFFTILLQLVIRDLE